MVNERQLLRLTDDLKFVDERLAELGDLLPALNLPSSSYRRQELLHEQATLQGHRRALVTKIAELTDHSPDSERVRANAERVEKLRQAAAERYRAHCIDMALEFERAGDFRNATLHRLESLRARQQAEAEIHSYD